MHTGNISASISVYTGGGGQETPKIYIDIKKNRIRAFQGTEPL